ncbi:MAG: efflux RND transporter permease subunit [Campylobacterota bacterium]|nr:efflux RND transporter permease subunit [Campylobacterota bacterium]
MKVDYESKNIAGTLAKAFLNSPLTMIMIVAILALGFISLEVMPREEDPQIEVSGGAIMIAIPGSTPREINNVVIKPLERKIREIKGVEHIYSMAMNNVGIVNVQYFIGENREESNLKLYDKVMQNMDTLPKGTMQPLVKPFDIDIDIPVVTVAFYPKVCQELDSVELYRTIRDIQQDMNAIDNVSKTTLKGEKKPQFNVMIDLDKLSGYHISLGQVAQAIQAISTNAPDIDTPTNTKKIVVFGVKNAIEDIEDLQNLIVAQYMGSPIYLRNIAEIEFGYDIQNFQEALIAQRDGGLNVVDPMEVKAMLESHTYNLDDKEDKEEDAKDDEDHVPLKSFHPKEHQQITLTISKLKGTNSVTIANDVVAMLEEYREKLERHNVGFIITRNYGERANEAVNELVFHLVVTIGIISLILIPFLGWRESLVVSIAVPMILATTLFIAYLTDQTINRITLFAFLLSIGLIVDDAIIVIENIHRRLHLKETEGQDFDVLICEATDEIGPSTNVATIAIILTMVPMAFVGGMMGQFMKPIPLNVPIALAVSLVVAYVFTPYLAKKLIKHPGSH